MGKKAPYKPENIDSAGICSDKKRRWIEEMLNTVEKHDPHSYGYKFVGRGQFHGAYYEEAADR